MRERERERIGLHARSTCCITARTAENAEVTAVTEVMEKMEEMDIRERPPRADGKFHLSGGWVGTGSAYASARFRRSIPGGRVGLALSD